MGLLAEYALTPDVFDATSYSSTEMCGARIDLIKDVLLHSGLVRNLRNGEWEQLLLSVDRAWHRRGKELLKKLKIQNRLITFASSRPAKPSSDCEWCQEALATHTMKPLTGIIATGVVAGAFHSHPLVASIDSLGSAPWWASSGESMRLDRTLTDYMRALNLILCHANSIMFVDPHIDLLLDRYKGLIALLQVAGNRFPRPRIEIHRVVYSGSGQHRQILNPKDIEANFRNELTSPLTAVGLAAEVFVWDHFHDRYLISDLVGIQVPQGFDTARASNAKTTWTRLCRTDRDDVQREFDPNGHRHKIHHQFTVP